MKRIVTLGEIMLRLSPPNHQKFEQAQQFDVVYGGGEANVAISLAKLGLQSSFVTKLPDNPLGMSAVQYLNRFGVLTNHILLGGNRIGIYFLEKGYSIRPSNVTYDRSNSAFALSKTEEYDFEAIFANADWFHISGITPALNEELFHLTKVALNIAKEKGITTSCDLNYRSALWSFETAREKMTELIKSVDVCIGIEPLILLDRNGQEMKDQLPMKPSVEEYKEIMKQICRQYGVRMVAMTQREQLSVNKHRLRALLFDGTNIYQSKEVEVDIIDRVGTGDAFSAGIIYSLLQNNPPQQTIDFATGCFALKHTIEGDANIISAADVDQFINGSISIKR
ncbi:sugar kinase [Heyndrickxia coagulans]|uniref:sugar kinase n=1 Tax=Heyndrickxia coagulans TaxID=1398 RepID=UPI0002F89B6D|nr:sugar kinase [Heyndrickxia coagulans]